MGCSRSWTPRITQFGRPKEVAKFAQRNQCQPAGSERLLLTAGSECMELSADSAVDVLFDR